MREPPTDNLHGLDLARRIEAACRRFETAWPASEQSSPGDYLRDGSGGTDMGTQLELTACHGRLDSGGGGQAGPRACLDRNPH
jgi:hypothetical protein